LLYGVFQSGGEIEQWVEAVEVPANLVAQFTEVLTKDNEWYAEGCFPKTDEGMQMPPKIEKLFTTKEGIDKGKKAVVTYAWDNCMSKTMKDLMRDIMKIHLVNVPETSDDIEPEVPAATSDDVKGVDFNDSDHDN
jgi:hypothetical protein